MGELAASSVASDWFFTVDEINSKVDMLKRLASVNPSTVAFGVTWRLPVPQTLGDRACHMGLADASTKRRRRTDCPAGKKSVAVLGAKSVVLENVGRAQRVGAACLWIDASYR